MREGRRLRETGYGLEYKPKQLIIYPMDGYINHIHGRYALYTWYTPQGEICEILKWDLLNSKYLVEYNFDLP